MKKCTDNILAENLFDVIFTRLLEKSWLSPMFF